MPLKTDFELRMERDCETSKELMSIINLIPFNKTTKFTLMRVIKTLSSNCLCIKNLNFLFNLFVPKLTGEKTLHFVKIG
jgi:hypothetical protein